MSQLVHLLFILTVYYSIMLMSTPTWTLTGLMGLVADGADVSTGSVILFHSLLAFLAASTIKRALWAYRQV